MGSCGRRLAWIACLAIVSAGAFLLQAGVVRTVEVVFDGSDACPTPVDVRNMAAVLP